MKRRMDNSITKKVNEIPGTIRLYLNARGLPDEILEKNKISFDSSRPMGRIVIPVFDKDKRFLFNKYRRHPGNEDGPKYAYDAGGSCELYGSYKLASANEVIICEGEFDSLVLEANGFTAVTSTGGAGAFKKEWAPLFANKKVFIRLDNDSAGQEGTIKIARIIPHALAIPMPSQFKDITDFFVEGKRQWENRRANNPPEKHFRNLMAVAFSPKVPPEPVKPKAKNDLQRSGNFETDLHNAKEIPISQYIQVNSAGFAFCPFHKEKTPSFKVFPDNKFKCFGCGKHGDVIDLVMRLHNFENILQAIRYMIK